MRHLWWGLIPFVAALVAIRAWWAEVADTVGLVTLVCGLAYVVMRTRRPIPPLRAEQTSSETYPHRQAGDRGTMN
jgi:hypothetical protein